MSVVYQSDLNELRDPMIDTRCALCAEPVEPPAVCWSGLELLLWHPRCAAQLGAHLIADAREADLAAALPVQWRRRLLRAVRERLVGEEAAA